MSSVPPALAASVRAAPVADAAADGTTRPVRETSAPDLDALPRTHARRLREVYRSAGWPVCDAVEIDLLAAGLLERVVAPAGGAETLRLTHAGIALLARTLRRNRAAFDAHEALVERVVLEMQRAGRIAWRGLSLRARVDAGWVLARPDVYSLRHTTVEAYLAPLVHEVKVRRADLLADLRLAGKRAAYLQTAAACSYVLAEGIAEPGEIPPECGVMVARRVGDGWGALECLRPAPQRALRMPFSAWMALARATPAALPLDDAQGLLGDGRPEDASAADAAAEDPPAEPFLQSPGAPFRPDPPSPRPAEPCLRAVDAPGEAPGADAGAGL
jgi:hypothetical protein